MGTLIALMWTLYAFPRRLQIPTESKCSLWEIVPLDCRNLPANAIFYRITSNLVPGLFLFCLAMSFLAGCCNMIFITKVSLLQKPADCLPEVLH